MAADPTVSSRTRLPRAEVDVSVALCTRNGAPWLDELLRSIAAQERLPDELVVSDDRSTDDTIAILERFARHAPFRVDVVVNEERLGSTENFARALQRCRGRFVALADQDDRWYPQKLQRLVGELEDDPTVTMAFSDADLIDASGEPLRRRLWDTRLVGRTLRRRAVVPEKLFAQRALTTGCTMIVRRRAVAASLPFPAELADPVAPMRHDRWLSLVAAAVGTVRAVPEALLAFRVHPGQETGVLVGHHLPAALGRAAVVAVAGPADQGDHGHLVRAGQLEAAAERADDLGDFEEAATLRAIAAHHRGRVQHDASVGDRLRHVAQSVRSGAYGWDRLGLGAAAGDVVRAVQPMRPRRSS